MGEYERAKRDYHASYTLREEFGDPEGMAVALAELGAVAFLKGDVQTAEDLYRHSLNIYRNINGQGGIVTTLPRSIFRRLRRFSRSAAALERCRETWHSGLAWRV